MVDILGPSGQPLPPNPFTQSQSQNVSANVSVNTQPAERAFADLQKVLDGLMKNFGVNWEKASHDGMAAQERFWRYMGDKQKEQEVALRRYSSEAINGIEKEKEAAITALKEKQMATEAFEKAKASIIEDAAKKEQRILDETDRKKKQSQGFGGMVRGARDALIQAGGPIGSTVAGIGNLIANPEIAIPAAIIGAIVEAWGAKTAFTKTGAQLAGAGLGIGSPAGTGLNFAQGLFGNTFSQLSRALSSDQQRDIIATMAGSRTMVGQATGTGGFGAIQRNLGLFANILPDASKEMEIFTDATKSLGMSQKDISNLFMSSRVNSDRLKITQLDAISTQMEMQKALRNITNDGTVAASVLFNVGGFLKNIGTSEAERQRMTLGIGQAGANLSLSQIVGMSAFTHGGKMPTPEALFGTGAYGVSGSKVGSVHNVFGLMGEFFTKVGGQAQDPMQRLFIADALNKQFGLGLRTQDMPQFFNLSEKLRTGGPGGISSEEYAKQVEKLSKQAKAMTVEGMDTLVNIVNPIQQLANMFTNFWRDLDSRINSVIEAIHHPFEGSEARGRRHTEESMRRDIQSHKFTK